MNCRPFPYQGNALPLSYPGVVHCSPGQANYALALLLPFFESCRQTLNWWGEKDSNLRRRSRQIYSLIPLAARESPPNIWGRRACSPYPKPLANWRGLSPLVCCYKFGSALRAIPPNPLQTGAGCAAWVTLLVCLCFPVLLYGKNLRRNQAVCRKGQVAGSTTNPKK